MALQQDYAIPAKGAITFIYRGVNNRTIPAESNHTVITEDLTMQYVPEDRFVELLNEELTKHAQGAYLPPFTLKQTGYDWPHSNSKIELVYLHVANKVREKYGIYH